MIVDGQTALLAFMLPFFVALSFAIDWCFCPRTGRTVARQARRADARRAAYRQLLEASQR